MKTVQTAVAIKNKKTGYIFVSTIAENSFQAWAKYNDMLVNAIGMTNEHSQHQAVNIRIEELTDEPIKE